MTALKKRPFAFSCCLFLLSSFLLFYTGLTVKIILSCIFAVLWCALFFYRKKSTFLTTFVLPPLITASLLSLVFFSIRYQNILTYSGKVCNAEFVITDRTDRESSTSYTLKIRKLNGKSVSFNALLYDDSHTKKELFTAHSADLTFSTINGSGGNHSPNYSYLSNGIYLYAYAEDEITDLGVTVKLFPSYYFKKSNIYLSSLGEKYGGGDPSALCNALLLGNRSKLSDEHSYNFRRLGLSHILAVSGMHLSLVIGTLDKLIEALNIGKRKKHFLLIVITFIYAGLTGFSQSINRAAVMLILYYASFLLAKRHDGITSLCFAAAFLCFVSPGSVFDIGLWLSFLATYGILTVASPINAKFDEIIETRSRRAEKAALKLCSMLIFGVVPVMFSIPAVWLSYGETSVVSPLTNILFTPFVSVIMYTFPFVLLFSFFPPFAKLIALIPTYASKLMLYLASLFAPHSPLISLNYDFTVYIIIFLVTAYLLTALTETKRKYLYFIPFVLSIIGFAVGVSSYRLHTANDTKLIYLNTPYGDSFVAVSQNKGLICDVSGGASNNAVRSEYLLNQNHITDVDGYVITDYNGKGMFSLKELLAATKLNRLYLPEARTDDEKLLRSVYDSIAQDHGLELITYGLDEDYQISFYDLQIDIKKLSSPPVNSPSALCLTFSGENSTLAYIGMGAYSTSAGKALLTGIFNQNIPLIFGTYGKKTSFPVTSLKYKNDPELYFPSEELKNFYSNTIPSDARITITDETFIFWFNR